MPLLSLTSGHREVVSAVRRWPLWSLPVLLRCYVSVVVAAAVAATAVAIANTPLRADELLTFSLLIGCGAASVEATRRQGEPAGVLAKDLLSAWWLPIALLLPPLYALLAPVPLMALTQLRVRRTVLHRRVFSIAAIGLAHALASSAFHAATGAGAADWATDRAAPGAAALGWTALAAGCALLAAVVNTLLVATAVRAASPETTWRELLWDRENLTMELTEVCAGLLVALIAGLHPLLTVLGLVPVLVLQRSLLHAQLRAAARTDAKTGLLNAATWEREAAGEILRAHRSHSPLAVLLMDIDHIKRVNDRHGHLAGDQVLRWLAGSLRAQLRQYDVIARFGGEEFAVLLPQTDIEEAMHTADRLRRCVAGLAVPSGDALITVTVSIGVAPLCRAGQDVTDLLAAADLALYRAKTRGRNQVHLG